MAALTDIDLGNLDTFVGGVPHEVFAQLRSEAPVFRHEERDTGRWHWCVTGYDEVVAVNRDNQLFSSARQATYYGDLEPDQLEQQRLIMLNMDPPMHTRYRLLVNKGFTPRMVSQLEAKIRQSANDIIDDAAKDVAELGSADFVVKIAAELPLQVIADLIGVPQEDRHKVFHWSNSMIGREDPEYGITDETAANASIELFAYASQLAAERRISPQEDLLSVLTRINDAGDSLSELEVDLFFLLLSVAGNETTRNLISHGMLALFEHPDQFAKLKADHSLVPSAVEEMLRWGSPVMHFRRTATADTVLGGQEIKEGDKVVIWYISANRDEARFPKPYDFDITRTPNDHVAFGGGGPHFCLGANLARLEIRVMFEELLKRCPDIEQAGPAVRLRSNFINGIKHLPVKF